MKGIEIQANDIGKVAMDLLRSTANEGTVAEAVARAYALAEEWVRVGKAMGAIEVKVK